MGKLSYNDKLRMQTFHEYGHSAQSIISIYLTNGGS